MTVTRSDLCRLGASLGVLGTLLEMKGSAVWDTLYGWQPGPLPAPARGERGGGGGETSNDDRKAEAAQRRRAGQHLDEHRSDLDQLDELVQRVMRRIDIACPPDFAELKNRRTGDIDPITKAEAVLSGLCGSCWRDNEHESLIPLGRDGFRKYHDLCDWCGSLKRTYGIEPPLDLLEAHHAGRRLSEAEVAAAVERQLTDDKPGKKGKKGKRSKRGKAA